MKDLLALRSQLMNFKVFDPACGSGNFLYLSYRELVRIEIALLAKLKESVSTKSFQEQAKTLSLVTPRQLYGIDRDSFGVELAKVTLMLAKKLALDEAIEVLEREQIELPLNTDEALPLDNLDANIVCADALFVGWPQVDAIVGNPPYQSKNKIIQELGRAYVNSVRAKFPEVPGRADYCVYWFRKAHDHLKPGQRAGLVGTNTIRQNYSRMGGLDYIVANGGTITEAVSTMKWSGEAAVDVSIVNWLKGNQTGLKRLYIQQDNNDASKGWAFKDLPGIGSSLSFEVDVTQARTIQANAARGGCYQGQTHGHEGFLLTLDQARNFLATDPKNKEVMFPYLIADELIGRSDALPTRYVIDFGERELLVAKAYAQLFERIEYAVLPDRAAAAAAEQERNSEAVAANPDGRIALDHANALNYWWLLFRHRGEMLKAIKGLSRFIACGRVTLRPIFEFVSPDIHPNDALMVFPFEDDYSFGILQSSIHWLWFTNRCSTLTGRYRYTSNTVFDSFPWPQAPDLSSFAKVAAAAVELRTLRAKLMKEHNLSFRQLYRALDLPGASPLKDIQEKLDHAVREAYGMNKSADPLAFLLALNKAVAEKEDAGEAVTGPGLPAFIDDRSAFVTDGCISMSD